MRPRWIGILLALSALVWQAPSADGYRFFARRVHGTIASAARAIRWDTSASPLRFQLVENDDLLADGGAELATLRTAAERAVSAWNEIPTSMLKIVLEEETATGAGARAEDRINTIGVSLSPDIPERGARALRQVAGERMIACDIRISAEYPLAIFDASGNLVPPEPLVSLLIHELGHCLGLNHSVANPVVFLRRLLEPGYAEDPIPPQPDPFMSYGADFGDFRLTPDDVVAASVLYPAPGFLASRGSVAGRVLFENGRPVRYAYVQTVLYRNGDALFGPGAFTDAWGQFLIEGLEPGFRHIWVRPLYSLSAHDGLELVESSLDFRHEQRWLEVGLGDTTLAPDIVVHPPPDRRRARP